MANYRKGPSKSNVEQELQHAAKTLEKADTDRAYENISDDFFAYIRAKITLALAEKAEHDVSKKVTTTVEGMLQSYRSSLEISLKDAIVKGTVLETADVKAKQFAERQLASTGLNKYEKQRSSRGIRRKSTFIRPE